MNLQHLLYTLANILNEMSPYILLGFLLAGFLHTFVRPEVMSRHLSGHGWKPVVKAALFGIPLPLCSCGVLPTAVALQRQGASRGATTSFLIATPQTGVDSIAATYALLGLPFAIVRPLAALVGSFAGGMAVDRSDRTGNAATSTPEPQVSCETGTCGIPATTEVPQTVMQKLWGAVRYGFVDMVASVGKWLVIGLIVAAIITVAVPDELFLSLAQHPILAMLVMVAVAVPMYVCATGSIPIALSLILKGLTPGVGFVLLMAGPAANFASVMVLKRSLGTRATALYVGAVVVTAIMFGVVIDYLLPASWFIPASAATPMANCHLHLNWFSTTCSVLLLALLANAFVRSRRERKQYINQTQNNNTTMQTIYKVKGMSCPHCKATVEKVVGALPGAISVKVDLPTGNVAVDGAVPAVEVQRAVTEAGFDFLGKA